MKRDSLRSLIWMVDPMERDLIQLIMRRLGLQPQVVHDLSSLSHHLEADDPVAIILDQVLPGANALDLIKQIKEQMGSNSPGTLVFSTLAFVDVINKAREMGVDEFLVKPIEINNLFKILVKYLK